MKSKSPKQQELWAEAQRRCRLSDEALRMAKELGLNPRSLIKNIPSRNEQWKAPVEQWVREIHEKRHGARSKRDGASEGDGSPRSERTP